VFTGIFGNRTHEDRGKWTIGRYTLPANPIFSMPSGEATTHSYWISRRDSIPVMCSGVRLVWATSDGKRLGVCCTELTIAIDEVMQAAKQFHLFHHNLLFPCLFI
jgi:hypothetical protein